MANAVQEQENATDPLQEVEDDETLPLLSPAKGRLTFSHVLRGLGTAVCIALIVVSCEFCLYS